MSISQHHLDSFEITEEPPWKTDNLPTSSQMIRDLAAWLDQVNQSGDDLRAAGPVTWVQQGENDIATAGIRRAFKLLQDEYRQEVDGHVSHTFTIDMICHIHKELVPTYEYQTNQRIDGIPIMQRTEGGHLRKFEACTKRPNGTMYKYPSPYESYQPENKLEPLLLTAFDIHNGNMLYYHEHMTGPGETNENKLIHLIKCAALMFCKIITIHPFGDGNGRLCRLLANDVLFDLIPLPIPFYDVGNVTKDTYFDAIMKHQDCDATSGDPSDFSALILHGLWHADKLHTLGGAPWLLGSLWVVSVKPDHTIRLYKPLESTPPIATGKGPSGSRGARLVWLDDTSFAISGFERSSDRQLSLYTLPDISNPVSSVTLSSSPAILIPHYDPDIKLFYLTGKGDTSVLTVEYCPDVHPHLFSTASFPIGTSHQALKFLPKTLCNVKTVEVARGVRLCKSTIEPLGFKIPRVKMEYFQDDLYCDTSVTWEPVMSPDEWLGGVTKKQKTISLRPDGMKLLSEMPVQAPSSSAKKYSSHVLHEKTDEEKKEELITAMMSKMNDKDSEPLPQDDMDGVDSDEWDDY